MSAVAGPKHSEGERKLGAPKKKGVLGLENPLDVTEKAVEK